MHSNAKAARIAGLLYLVVSIPGFFSLMYIPSHFIVSGDANYRQQDREFGTGLPDRHFR